MRILIAALLSAALIGTTHQAPPVKNLESKAVVAETTGQTPQTSEQPDTTVKQAETPAPTPVAPPAQETPATQPEIVTPVEDAKAFIYQSESGNDPTKYNSIGCFGLGQDCNGIVQPMCGTDYTCQDTYFTSYMLRRYGSWEAAKSFWIARVPINGLDVGNWW